MSLKQATHIQVSLQSLRSTVPTHTILARLHTSSRYCPGLWGPSAFPCYIQMPLELEGGFFTYPFCWEYFFLSSLSFQFLQVDIEDTE